VIHEKLNLTKAGIEIVITAKGRRKRSGTLTVSIGGVRWFPYKAKKPSRMSWKKFAELLEGHGSI
jgi:hypothetical protein